MTAAQSVGNFVRFSVPTLIALLALTFSVWWSGNSRSVVRIARTGGAAMRIVSYNLRYDVQPDNVTVKQSLASLSDPLEEPHYLRKNTEQPWSTRRLRVSEHLLGEGIVLAGSHLVQDENE